MSGGKCCRAAREVSDAEHEPAVGPAYLNVVAAVSSVYVGVTVAVEVTWSSRHEHTEPTKADSRARILDQTLAICAFVVTVTEALVRLRNLAAALNVVVIWTNV